MDVSADEIRLSHTTKSTDVLGPGRRFVLWVQGCQKRCYKCINPEGQDRNGGYIVSVKSLFDDICGQKGIQGVTISGGEPFLQFPSIFKLVMLIREYTNLDIMLYSGYTYQEICSRFPEPLIRSFFEQIDIFVDGQYFDELNDDQMYRGSSNQRFYFFTDKYKAFQEQIEGKKNRRIEFELTEESEVFLVGIPPKNFYGKFISLLQKAAEKESEGTNPADEGE